MSRSDRKATAQIFLRSVVEDVRQTRERIKHYIRKTPLDHSVWLSEETSKTSVYFKLESEQITGSVKARGAFNKMCIIGDKNKATENKCSVTTASSGNHGQACALAMQTLGINGRIFVPECAADDKIMAIKKFGGVLEIFGDDCVKTEARARQYAEEMEDCVYISPYNDTNVIHGQATIGLEILEDLPDVDTIFISVGGGGLISGIATYVKAVKPSVKRVDTSTCSDSVNTTPTIISTPTSGPSTVRSQTRPSNSSVTHSSTQQIIGCQPDQSCVMFESIKAGKILDIVSYPTLSDGTAGGVDPNSFTFDLCCEYVDKWILVSEDEISQAMYFMLEKHHKLVEGAAAVCIAAYMKTKSNHKEENIVLVMCGANVGVKTVKNVLNSNITN